MMDWRAALSVSILLLAALGGFVAIVGILLFLVIPTIQLAIGVR